jgi:O-antigen/teichoic acid export membrane protein
VTTSSTGNDPGTGRLVRYLGQLAGHAFALRLAGAALALGGQIVLARIMQKHEYGVFIYATAWIAVLSQAALFGLDTALIRWVASYKASQEWALFSGVVRYSVRTAAAIALLLAAALAVLVWLLGAHVEDSVRWALLIGATAIPTLVVLRIRSSVLQGLERVVEGRLPELVVQPTVAVGVVALWWALSPQPVGSAESVAAWSAAFVPALLLARRWQRASSPVETAGVEPRYHGDQWVRVAVPLALVAGFVLLNQRLDVLMLGSLSGTSEVGPYSAAARVAGLILWGKEATNAILAPVAARLHAARDTAPLQEVSTRAARLAAAVAVPGAVALVAFGGTILGLFGPGFVEGFRPMVVLVGGHCVAVAAGSVGFLLVMTGHQRAAAAGMGMVVVINVVLNALLIPRFGALGAAWATASSAAILHLGLAVVVWRRLGLDPTVFGLLRARG